MQLVPERHANTDRPEIRGRKAMRRETCFPARVRRLRKLPGKMRLRYPVRYPAPLHLITIEEIARSVLARR
jgi:hypothetical protein